MNPFLFALLALAIGFFILAKFAETKDDKVALVLLGTILLAVFAITIASTP